MTYRNPDTESRILERLDALHARVERLKPEADPTERTQRVFFVVSALALGAVVGFFFGYLSIRKSDSEECAAVCGARGVSRFVDSSGGKDTCERVDHKRIPATEDE